jgi:hypothetical protein
MDLKIVSGVLVTTAHPTGRAVIDYSRNTIVDGDLDPADLKKERRIAPSGMLDSYFDSNPCSIVALRQVEATFIDRDDFGARPSISETDRFDIGSDTTNTRLTIEWKSSGGQIEEISYMALGPVSAPPEGPH